MLVEVLEPISTKRGTLTPGQVVEMPETIAAKLVGKVRPALPFGLTLADLQAEYGHDTDWPRMKNDPRWLHFLAETTHRRRNRQEEGKKKTADTRTADRLTPAERSKWCLSHELTRPGHRCRNKNRLEGCTLWQAVKGKQRLPPIGDHRGV